MESSGTLCDLTGACYLALQHARDELRPWDQLTSGAPAAMTSCSDAEALAESLASVQGRERAVLGPSTLHLYADLFGLLSAKGIAVYVDAGAYPISRWGVERAAGRGVPVRQFAHHDPAALRDQIEADAGYRLRPIVVADGFCTICGEPAPIGAYIEAVHAFGGQLILDDTQALGILGHAPTADAPYGRGGGGSLRWHGLEGSEVLVISSMAKGFGVPLAVLAGSEAMVRWFEAESETRVHCSPPCRAVTHAAEHALAVNESDGDAIRLRLAERVQQFRSGIHAAGFSASGGLFPVQTLAPLADLDGPRLHDHLEQRGIRTLLLDRHAGRSARVMLLFTARHSPQDIQHVVAGLTQAAVTESMA